VTFNPGKDYIVLMTESTHLIDYGLNSKVALITGVSRRIGIGAAAALELAKVGCNIFTTWYSPYDSLAYGKDSSTEAQEVLEAVRAQGVNADGMQADLSNPQAPALLFDAVEQALGPVDILINNAAYSLNADIYTLTAELMDAHYAVNLRGTVLLCAEFARRHSGRPGGRIINMTSGQSVGPMPAEIPYITTKGAIEALTTSLSEMLIPKGITVNAVDPGATDTGWINPELYAQLVAASPTGQVGTPQDAARIVLFLASSQAGWVTGQVIHSRGSVR
jgi:3-oxoacyl-[acyl-carrier protein] reductase